MAGRTALRPRERMLNALPIEGAAAEAAAYHAEAEDEHGMEDAALAPAKLPNQPTAKEVEAHCVAHTPYRA